MNIVKQKIIKSLDSYMQYQDCTVLKSWSHIIIRQLIATMTAEKSSTVFFSDFEEIYDNKLI